MNAREMFEQLGYEENMFNDNIEQIFTKNMEVGFKEIVLCSDGSYTYHHYGVVYEQTATTYGEHLAIAQRMKELGWL